MGNWQQLSPSQYHTLDLGVAFGITDVGTVRPSNQDNFYIAPELGLLAVADGMGGHAAGDVASAEAIRQLASFLASSLAADRAGAAADIDATVFPPPHHGAGHDPDATWTGAAARAVTTLRDAVDFANAHLYALNRAAQHPEGTGMGTTLTGMWQPAPGGPVFAFHIGDSRLYRWRDGTLTQLSRDQTLYQQALDLGVPEPLPPRNLLLQALGPAAAVQPDLMAHATAPGDVYLLCSDGLHGESAAGEIAAIMADARADTLQACCTRLVEMAKRDGSRDNITALLLRCHG